MNFLSITVPIPLWGFFLLSIGAIAGLAITIALIHDVLEDRKYWKKGGRRR